MHQSSKITHWQEILEDTQKFNPDNKDLTYSKPFINKIEALIAAKRKEDPSLSIEQLEDQANQELQQQAIRKLIRWDTTFATHVLFERLRQTENPAVIERTRKYLITDLKVLTNEQVDTLTYMLLGKPAKKRC